MVQRAAARFALREHGLMAVILAVALGVRWLGAGWALPYLREEDPSILWQALGMLSFSPAFWHYASAFIGALFPVMYLHYATLHAHGVVAMLRDIQLSDPQTKTYWWYLNPPSFYLWARATIGLLGAATVFAVYRLGKAAYGPAEGLIAAGLLALAPGAVFFANLVNTDIPMALPAVLAAGAGCAIIRRGRRRDYAFGGFAAGLAIATEASAVMIVATLLIAHLLRPRHGQPADRRPAVMALCLAAGLVIGLPSVLLAPRMVLPGMLVQLTAYGGLPTLETIRVILPGYLSYFAWPSDQNVGVIFRHAGLGALPALFAVFGAAAGFRRDRRMQLYLLSFPVLYVLYTAGIPAFYFQRMMPVLPFATLFAGLGCVEAWRMVRGVRWLTAPSLARGLTGMALLAVLITPARDSAVLAARLNRQPDTRTAAVRWLRDHVSPGARIALEEDLRWYLPDIERLPFAVQFAPRAAPLDWYVHEHIEFALIGAQNPLSSLPAVIAFPWPANLYGRPERQVQGINELIDPTVNVVRPSMPGINAAFPVSVGADEMIPEPIVQNADSVYSEVVHFPAQRFSPGSYLIAAAGEWPRFWTELNFRYTKVKARVWVGNTVLGPVTLTGAQPLGFTTPAIRIDRTETLPLQAELTFWIQRTPGARSDRSGFAFQPSSAGCATLAAGSQNAYRLDTQHVTVEAWVYPVRMNATAGGGETEAPILGKGKHLGYYLRLVGDRTGRIFADLSVAGKFSVGRAGVVPLRKWTHIAATYDGHEARIYINGTAAVPDRTPEYAGAVKAKDYPFLIGCRDPGPDQTLFNGFITGVRVWERVLSPKEVRIEAGQQPLLDSSAGLVGSWSFLSIANGTILDLSDEANNLSAKELDRLPPDAGFPGRPVWTSGRINLIRTVRIEREEP